MIDLEASFCVGTAASFTGLLGFRTDEEEGAIAVTLVFDVVMGDVLAVFFPRFCGLGATYDAVVTCMEEAAIGDGCGSCGWSCCRSFSGFGSNCNC